MTCHANTGPDPHELTELLRKLGAVEVVTLHGTAGAQLLFDLLPYLTTDPRILRERLDVAGPNVQVLVVCFLIDEGAISL